MFLPKRYTISFQDKNSAIHRVVIEAKSERKARKTCHEDYGDSINIISIQEKRDSSLPEDDDWA